MLDLRIQEVNSTKTCILNKPEDQPCYARFVLSDHTRASVYFRSTLDPIQTWRCSSAHCPCSPLCNHDTLIGWLPVITPCSLMSAPSSTQQSSRGSMKTGGSRRLHEMRLRGPGYGGEGRKEVRRSDTGNKSNTCNYITAHSFFLILAHYPLMSVFTIYLYIFCVLQSFTHQTNLFSPWWSEALSCVNKVPPFLK